MSRGANPSSQVFVAVLAAALLLALVPWATPVAGQTNFGGICGSLDFDEQVRFFNASNIETVEIAIANEDAITAANGTLVSVPLATQAPVAFSVNNPASGDLLLSAVGRVLPRFTTIVLYDSDDGVALSFYEDILAPTPPQRARFALRHFAPVGDIDFSIDGQTGTAALTQQGGGTVAAGSVPVSVSSEGLNNLIGGSIQVDEGSVTVAYLYLDPAGAPSLRVDVTDVGVGTAPNPDGTCEMQETCDSLTVTVDLAQGELPTDGDDVILGTDGADVIAAGDGDDVICGLGGDDQIWGQGGADRILGGDGADRLRGGPGDDDLRGDSGADDLAGGSGNDVVDGGDGDDTKVRGGTGDDTVLGGPGNDGLVAGNGGQDQVDGGPGDDALVTGGPRPDSVSGGAGNDLVKGNKGADMVFGGGGDDELLGGPQPDMLDGGEGADTCNGGTTGGDPAAIEADLATGCEDVLAIP